MSIPRSPNFTDALRWQYGPYADAKASQEPNYLRDKFARIIEAQTRGAAELSEKVAPMKRAGK